MNLDDYLIPGKLYQWKIDDTDHYGIDQWSTSMVKRLPGQMAVRHWPKLYSIYLLISFDECEEEDYSTYFKLKMLSPDGVVVEDDVFKKDHIVLRWLPV